MTKTLWSQKHKCKTNATQVEGTETMPQSNAKEQSYGAKPQSKVTEQSYRANDTMLTTLRAQETNQCSE